MKISTTHFVYFMLALYHALSIGNAYAKKNITKKQQQKNIAAKNSETSLQNKQDPAPAEFCVTISNKHDKHFYPPAAFNDDHTVEINFNNSDLQNIINWISELFRINFLFDNNLQPPASGAQPITNKLTFKMNKGLSKKEVWDLFNIFRSF